MNVDDEQSGDGEGLGSPEHWRSGRTVDEAVAKFEAGSEVEGEHTPSGQATSGKSRAERMVDVDLTSTNRSEADRTSETDG